MMKVVGMVRMIALDIVELVHLSNGKNHGFPELVWLVVLLIIFGGFLSGSGSLPLDRALLVHTRNWSSKFFLLLFLLCSASLEGMAFSIGRHRVFLNFGTPVSNLLHML